MPALFCLGFITVGNWCSRLRLRRLLRDQLWSPSFTSQFGWVSWQLRITRFWSVSNIRGLLLFFSALFVIFCLKVLMRFELWVWGGDFGVILNLSFLFVAACGSDLLRLLLRVPYKSQIAITCLLFVCPEVPWLGRAFFVLRLLSDRYVKFRLWQYLSTRITFMSHMRRLGLAVENGWWNILKRTRVRTA